jgi:branched-chain amino acid transport system ATP-binding protein
VSGELLIEGISVAYDKADVLENVSLRVRPKKITCLLGSNGSGKTTLIRAILSLTPPREGRIIFDGIELTGRPTHRVIAAGLACIPEGRRVFPKLSVEDNLRLGAYLERSTKLIAERVSAVFEIFPKLHERRRQLAGTLSGGEQAMVSIGRGLMAEPRLLLIDEPSLGLSPRLVDECFDVIDKVRAKGITIFLVEQNVHQSLDIADYGYVLSKGRVVAAGDPNELISNPDMQRAYFGEGVQ